VTSDPGWRFEAAAAPPRLVPSVRARSALASLVVVALALGVGGAILFYVLQRSLIGGLDDGAAVRAAVVAEQLRVGGVGGLDGRLKSDDQESQLVQVVNQRNQVVASSGSRHRQEPISGLRAAGGEVRREDAGPFKIISTERPFLVLARGVRSGDVDYTVLVASYLQGQRDSVETVLRLLAIGFPILLVLVGLAVWVLIGRALDPVEQIRRRVAGIGGAMLDERVPVPPTRDEIAQLAITMNQMLDRLQAAQRAQRQFVSDASHELRSPLATLTATLEVADADTTGRTWQELRSVMAAEAARMATLVEGLLLLARADDLGLRIVAQEVDLDDLLESEARRLRTSSRLAVSTKVEPVRVVGDRQKLSQVVRNLVDNASRHAVGGIQLGLTTAAGVAVITVDDDGQGVPEAERERVFERFVRLDEARDRASGGAGLGLAIVREIVRGHHGQVGIGTSSAGGARVEVRLPLPPPAQPPVADSR
jgi:signal transduction histidine kinase